MLRLSKQISKYPLQTTLFFYIPGAHRNTDRLHQMLVRDRVDDQMKYGEDIIFFMKKALFGRNTELGIVKIFKTYLRVLTDVFDMFL